MNTGVDTSSLALDDAGNPLILFWDGSDTRLSTRTLGVWTEQWVHASGLPSTQSLARDSTGGLHATLKDASNGDLVYASNATGPWTSEVADGTGVSTSNMQALAVDSSGTPHIAYAGNTGMKHAWRTAPGSWQVETIDGIHSLSPYGVKMAIDSVGRIYVAYSVGGDYSDGFSDDVMLAVKDGAWSVNVAVNNCSHQGLALWEDEPGISCNGPDGLMYSEREGSTWTTVVVDSTGGGLVASDKVGRYSDLAVDSRGTPHISYYVVGSDSIPNNPLTPSQLHYATIGPLGSWHVETVDHVGQRNGLGSSIEVDSFDRPRISYFHWRTLDSFSPVPTAGLREAVMYAEPLSPVGLG